MLEDRCVRVAVEALYGWMSVVMVSAKQVWMCHIWEDSLTQQRDFPNSQRPSGLAPTSQLLPRTLCAQQVGDPFHKIVGLQRYTGVGKGFASDQPLNVYIVASEPRRWYPSMGVNEKVDYQPQIDMVKQWLGGDFSQNRHVKTKVVKYTALEKVNSRSRVLFEYMPGDQTDEDARNSYKVWTDYPAIVVGNRHWRTGIATADGQPCCCSRCMRGRQAGDFVRTR